MRQDSCRQQHTARLTFSSFYGTKSTGCSGYREQLKIQEKPASAWGGVGALCCSVSETDALDIIRTSLYTCGCQGAPELGLHWVRSETPHPFSSVRVSSREDPLFLLQATFCSQMTQVSSVLLQKTFWLLRLSI